MATTYLWIHKYTFQLFGQYLEKSNCLLFTYCSTCIYEIVFHSLVSSDIKLKQCSNMLQVEKSLLQRVLSKKADVERETSG